MTRIECIGVVIPAHDEEELLGACLASVDAAAAAVADRCRVEVVVVLDDCTDASARIAQRYGADVASVSARSVGVARRAGVARLDARERGSLWIANTDADSVVPRDWLAHHLRLADAGADIVLGPVRPDFAGLTAAHVDRWRAEHPPGVATGNTFGANLGVRASVYDGVGGFDRVSEHEDVRLVDRARRRGASVVATADGVVVTSARLQGRTPGGYAGYLRRVAAELAAGVPVV